MTSAHENSEIEAMARLFETDEDFQAFKRALSSAAPREHVSPEHLDWVRRVDAQQSLSSPLYAAKAARLGMEEYFRQYLTSRVR